MRVWSDDNPASFSTFRKPNVIGFILLEVFVVNLQHESLAA
jgi:hypothetical protein